jgi:hypothetical protein
MAPAMIIPIISVKKAVAWINPVLLRSAVLVCDLKIVLLLENGRMTRQTGTIINTKKEVCQ